MNRIIYIFTLLAMVSLLSTPMAFGCSTVEVRQGMDLVKVFAAENTKYLIKQDIDLGGKTIKVGANSTLIFEGGSLANGKVVGNNTKVKAADYEIFKRGYTRYKAYKKATDSPNDPPTLIREYHNCIIIEGTWDIKRCGSKWTGLLNGSEEDVMLAVRNYAKLHAKGAKVVFPTFDALGYESVKLPGGHNYDFNNSTISYPDDLSIWEDRNISLPNDAILNSLESNHGLLSLSNRTKISNLSIDGKSIYRQNEQIRLGVSCIIAIGDAQQVTLENISLSNVLGPGITAQSGSRDVLFENCHFFNIGEHILYSHQYKGFCRFKGCTFDTWDSERLSVYRNGMNYLFKCDPPTDQKDASYEELYRFDVAFTECRFNNPKRVNSQGRTLGGFLTGSFPVVISIINCRFTGAYPPLNPGGGATISEKSGKNYKMIVRNCDGAPYVYPSKSNYNIVTEYYDCTNIPFRTVYARRYENCKLYIDLYEDNIENVSTSFENDFSDPLVIKGCEFYERGANEKTNHPVFHRAIHFENCSFEKVKDGLKTTSLLTVMGDRVKEICFSGCDIDESNMQLVAGKQVKCRLMR